MKTQSRCRYFFCAFAALGLSCLPGNPVGSVPKDDKQPTQDQPIAKKIEAEKSVVVEIDGQKDDKQPSQTQPAAKKVEWSKNVFLEIEGDKRRVLVNAVVCLRTGMLEQLLCKKLTKEHEAILSADIDAEKIHAALLAAGAEPGSPVKFRPTYSPASGTVIKIYIQYEEKGKTIKVPAQEWVRNIKSRKQLTHDWVFGGSYLFKDQFDPKSPPIYGANDGDVICVANFPSAMLDLPISSSADNDDLDFEAFTERIPPLDTNVVVILEPVVAPKKK